MADKITIENAKVGKAQVMWYNRKRKRPGKGTVIPPGPNPLG